MATISEGKSNVGSIRKNRRAEVRQQDVFEYRKDIEVAARPVNYDTRVQPKNTKGGSAQALLDALDISMSGMQLGAQVIDKTAANYEKAGKIAAASGEPLSTPKSIVPGAEEAYVRGHEIASGMAAVANWNSTIQTKHLELMADPDVTPEQYQAEMKGMEISFLSGQSDAFKEGAIAGGALDMRPKLAMDYAEDKRKKFQAKGLHNINGIADTQLKAIMELPETTDKEIMMKRIAARNFVSRMQELGQMEYGLEKTTVTDSLIKHLKPIAIENGQPELYMWAFEPDESGIVVARTEQFGNEIYNNMRLADDQRKANIALADKQAKLQVEEDVTNALRGVALAIKDGSRESINDALKAMENVEGAMTMAQVESVTKALQNYESGIGYAPAGMGSVELYQTLLMDASDNELSIDMLSDYRENLEPAQYNKVLNKLIASREQAVTRARNKSDPQDDMIDDIWKFTKTTLNRAEKGMFGPADPIKGSERSLQGYIYWNRLVEDFKKNRLEWLPNPDSRKPDYDELTKLALKTQFEMYKLIPDKAMANVYKDPAAKSEDEVIKGYDDVTE